MTCGAAMTGRFTLWGYCMKGPKVALAVLTAMFCVAGCAMPAPASDAVKVTTVLADVDGCNLLGKVIVADGSDAEKKAREETRGLGGNVLLRKNDQVWNGNAYQCPAGTH